MHLLRLVACLLILCLASTAAADERRLGTAPAPSELDVSSTTWVDAGPQFALSGQMSSSAVWGGGVPIYMCSAGVVVKDAAAARLKVRVTFNGKAVASPAQTVTNADGSITRLYLVVNPPGSGTCLTKLQVARASGPTIQLRAAPAPPEEDQFSLSVPTPVN